jgi:ubiquinone/menaquinone biosynthesis C-methylase UbiE
MAQPDQYLLDYRRDEQQRLQDQAQTLADEARRMFDRVGVFAGARVVEIGCGPQGNLDLLAERVGPSGTVTGIERSEEAVRLARRFVADRKLANVEVIHGDGRATGLPRSAFDLATARLVLVNVPQPEQIVAEMAALVRPGGNVAIYEADWAGGLCDPPLDAWNRAVDLVHKYSSMNGIDLFVGRKVPRMLREAGLVDIQVDCLVHVCPPGHCQRMLLPHFVENLRDRILAQKIIGEDELNDLLRELKRHIDDPQTLVLAGFFFQAWGRRPEQSGSEVGVPPQRRPRRQGSPIRS